MFTKKPIRDAVSTRVLTKKPRGAEGRISTKVLTKKPIREA